MWCLECLRELFSTYSCFSSTPLSFSLSVLENKLCGYADDSTFVIVVLSLLERVAGAESLNRYSTGLVSGVTLG